MFFAHFPGFQLFHFFLCCYRNDPPAGVVLKENLPLMLFPARHVLFSDFPFAMSNCFRVTMFHEEPWALIALIGEPSMTRRAKGSKCIQSNKTYINISLINKYPIFRTTFSPLAFSAQVRDEPGLLRFPAPGRGRLRAAAQRAAAGAAAGKGRSYGDLLMAGETVDIEKDGKS